MHMFVKTITFGRHGESEQNVIGPEMVVLTDTQRALFRERDGGDHRLTERGVADGERMGDMIRAEGLRFDILAASTFVRALETLLGTRLTGPVEISPLIDERYTGHHERLFASEVKTLYPNAKRDRKHKETRWRPENGESMRDVLTRVLLFMEHLDRLLAGRGDALVVAHSRVIASYMWWAEQLENHEVPVTASDKTGGLTIKNGELVRYGWATPSLRPTHKRTLSPGEGQSTTWQELPKGPRFNTLDLELMVNKYPRIL